MCPSPTVAAALVLKKRNALREGGRFRCNFEVFLV